ncbi:Polyketide cyclase / dehydrase and lipid transport [Fictibacillus enclensis]|uniref:ATPase n=1 Tax=Fictibacillus enclensis TaxID=1017270 RepID=A0A0V8J236_9BACL|nr:SRPBCC family protein [Fictibacillus enclensis]KSU81141.1 ATPase [Fictibacillus enclensis]SCC35460.1 Polyketide cyclase / dehydrase and lipid transport [Fictibacillus enclensis]
MVDVVTEIIINCPIEKVSSYASDPENAPTWYVNIHSAEWKTPKPLKVGSKIAFKAKFLGRELAYVYEIVGVIPEKELAMKTANGPFPMETIYTWSSLDHNQTRMILRNKGNPEGFSKIITPFISKMMKKANMKDLQKLKYILENPS